MSDDNNYWSKLMETDEQAATYMESYGEGKSSPLRVKLASYLKPEEWVLDVGCGPGWNFETFLEAGPSVYYRGLDYSERFVRVANQRTGMKIFKLGDVRKIPEPDKSFDVVIMQDVLEHTNDYKEPIREALRVSRRLIIVTFWHLVEEQEQEHINDVPEENDLDGWGAWWARPDWEKYLDSLGLDWTSEKLDKWNIYLIKEPNGAGTPTGDNRRTDTNEFIGEAS